MPSDSPDVNQIGAGVGDAASIGVGASTGNPIAVLSGVIGLVGVGMSLFGTAKASSAASQEATISEQEFAAQEQENNLRQQQMVLQSGRLQMENIRKLQLAQATGKAAAVNQGGQFGSGVAGGYAQESAEAGTNMVNINQNLSIGKNIFGLQNQISGYQQQMAALQGNASTAQGISQAGNEIAQASGPLGRIFSGFGTNTNNNQST